MNTIIKPEKLNIREHVQINEKFIQNLIADDPSIIGLGDLLLVSKERIQPRAGRLDLLLSDQESGRRYEVEVQLGKTDESHIIRTIEYWDIERKRYPQYDHCAVIIAEDITSRFSNVIGLFNGFIPLIAIQMNAYRFGDQIGLVFTKVLDEIELGLVEEDEVGRDQPLATRDFWVKKCSIETLTIVDKFVGLLKELDPSHNIQYNKTRIAILKGDQVVPFLILRPRKRNHVVLVLRIPKSEKIDAILENSDLDYMDFIPRPPRYRIKLRAEDISHSNNELKQLIAAAFSEHIANL